MEIFPSEDPKEALKLLGLRAKKRLGQHFLVRKSVISRIIEAAQITSNDTVLEVGPGLGILTEALAERAQNVVVVEVDRRLASALKKKFHDYPHVKVFPGDILNTPPELLLEGLISETNSQQISPARTYKVVANLPYYITAPVIRHFLEANWKPRLMVIMVQKEVAEVITAAPGSMSLLSISVQFYCKPYVVDYVPAEDFYPQPKVDSAVVCMDVFEKPVLPVDDVALFFKIVSAGFSSRRKQIHNALSH